MKRNSILSLVIAMILLLFVGTVSAHASGPYVGLYAGGNVPGSSTAHDTAGDFGLSFTPAVQGSAVLGWNLEPGSSVGEGRIELEYSHRSNRLDKVTFVEGTVAGGGELTSDSLLFNCFAVSREPGSYHPYLGVGAGAARVVAANLTVSRQPFSNDSSIVFAYQAGIGIDISLTKHLTLDLGYRFFATTPVRFTEVGGRVLAMEYTSHAAVLGIKAGF